MLIFCPSSFERVPKMQTRELPFWCEESFIDKCSFRFHYWFQHPSPPPFHFPSLFSTISNCKYFSLCKFLSNWFFLLGRVTSKTSNIQQNWREKTTKAIDGMFLECMSPLLKDWNLQYLIRKFHIHFNHIVIVVMQNTFTYPLDKWLWGQCVIVSTFFSAFLSECKKKSKIPSSPAPRRW